MFRRPELGATLITGQKILYDGGGYLLTKGQGQWRRKSNRKQSMSHNQVKPA
jgi:hypothetical protein